MYIAKVLGKKQAFLAAAVAGIGLMSSAQHASAAELTWGTTGTGGGGTWDTTTSSWYDGTSAQVWGGDLAKFAGTAGTVTVGAPVSANGITFTTTGYTLSGTDAITLTGTGNLVTDAGATATIAAPLAGTINKSGAGTVVYRGTTLGSLGLNGGTWQFYDTNNGSAATLNFGSNVTLSGTSTLQFTRAGASTGAVTYNMGTLTLGGGTLNYSYSNGSGYYWGYPKAVFTSTTLTADSAISITQGGAQSGGGITTGAITGNHTLSIASTNTQGFAPGKGGNYSGLSLAGTGTVTLDVTAASGTVSDATSLPSSTLTFAGAPVRFLGKPGQTMTSAAAITVSANTTVTLDQTGATGATTYKLGTLSIGANTLTVSSSGGNFWYGSPSFSYTGTTLTGNATFSTSGHTTGNPNLVNLSLGTVTGAYGITKAGADRLTVGAGSSYSGGTTIVGGTLTAAGNGALGTGDVTITPSSTANSILDLSSNALTATGGAIADSATLSLGLVTGTTNYYGVVAFGTSTLNETVGTLVVNGVPQAAGTYTSTTLPNYITGAGSITVVPEPAMVGLLALAGGLLVTRRRVRRV